MDDGYDSSRASDANYVADMFEEMRGILQTINDGGTAIRQELAQMPKRPEFDELKQEVKATRAVVTDLSREVNRHQVVATADDLSRCAGRGCDLLASAKHRSVPGFIAAIYYVRRALGGRVFLCWRCAGQRYWARQAKAC
jgi:hypothetical protein